MRWVEIGSSAEAGSSSSRISGLTAIARAMHRRCCWPPERPRPLCFSLSLTSSHSAARRSADLDALVEFGLRQLFVEPDAEGDVVVDRHRERRRLLEHHADLGAQQVEIAPGGQDVLAVDQHLAGRALAGIKLVDAVEDAQQGRLAAARGADKGGHPVVVERQVDVLQRLRGSVIEIDVPNQHLLARIGRQGRMVRDGRQRLHCGNRSGAHGLKVLHEASKRATMLRNRMVTVISSAPPQARVCQSA